MCPPLGFKDERVDSEAAENRYKRQVDKCCYQTGGDNLLTQEGNESHGTMRASPELGRSYHNDCSTGRNTLQTCDVFQYIDTVRKRIFIEYIMV